MIAALQREWQAFWLALGFLTRIPMLARIDYSQRLMNQSSVYFPLVGLLLGGLYLGLFALLAVLWPQWVCVVLVLGFHLWITGAFHEDGWADSVDALGGGYTIEDRLRIMKDSRIGTYGTLALVFALALKGLLIPAVDPLWLAWLLPPVVARLTPLWLMTTLDYVTDRQQSRSKPVADGFGRARLAVATLATLIPLGLWLGPRIAALAVLAVALTGLAWGLYCRRALGGYTGDALGASVILAELVLLLALAGRF